MTGWIDDVGVLTLLLIYIIPQGNAWLMSNKKKPGLEAFLGTFSQEEEAVRLLNIYEVNDLGDDRDTLLLHACYKGWTHLSRNSLPTLIVILNYLAGMFLHSMLHVCRVI